MASTIELNDGVLSALASSDVYEIAGNYGTWVAVQNPWREPLTITHEGRVVAELQNSDDWLAAPEGFYDVPQFHVSTHEDWLNTARPAARIEEPHANTMWETPKHSPASMESLPAQHGTPSSGFAVAGLIASFVAPIVGLILSIVAFKRFSPRGPSASKTLAIIGICVGGLGTALFALLILSFLGAGIASQQASTSTGAQTAPAYWESALEDVEKITQQVQPAIVKSSDYEEVCEYGSVTAHYNTNNEDLTESQREVIYDQYVILFGEYFADQSIETTVSSSSSSEKDFSIRVEHDYTEYPVNDEAPRIDVTISDYSTSIYVYGDCV